MWVNRKVIAQLLYMATDRKVDPMAVPGLVLPKRAARPRKVVEGIANSVSLCSIVDILLANSLANGRDKSRPATLPRSDRVRISKNFDASLDFKPFISTLAS